MKMEREGRGDGLDGQSCCNEKLTTAAAHRLKLARSSAVQPAAFSSWVLPTYCGRNSAASALTTPLQHRRVQTQQRSAETHRL